MTKNKSKKMKTLLSGSILLCSILFFSSCQKDNSLNNEVETTKVNNLAVSLIPQGFLKFNTSNDFIAFSKKILNAETKESVLKDLSEKGFKSRNFNIASRNSDTTNPYNLIFNADGLLEIDNVIMKISDDDQFLYTMKEEYSNPETFNGLVNEVYNAIKMNKINVNRNLTAEFNFSDFSTQNPFGVEEARNNASLRRPMFGHVTSTSTSSSDGYDVYGNCIHTVVTTTSNDGYIFWIHTSHSETYTTVTSPGTHC